VHTISLRRWTRTGNWDPDEKWEGISEILPLIDIYLSNAAEALAITGENEIMKAGEVLSSQGNIVVIKSGAGGAVAFKREQVWRVIPDDNLPEVIQVIDTIGAGDSFDAGFIRAWQMGWSVPECLKLAIRCGTACVTGRGGFERQLREVIE